jgi:hypothetical protein
MIYKTLAGLKISCLLIKPRKYSSTKTYKGFGITITDLRIQANRVSLVYISMLKVNRIYHFRFLRLRKLLLESIMITRLQSL